MRLNDVINKLSGSFEIDIKDQNHVYLQDEPFCKEWSNGKWNMANEEWYKRIKDKTVKSIHVTINEHGKPAIWIVVKE